MHFHRYIVKRTKWWSSKYIILDEERNPVYKIASKIISFKPKFWVENFDGEEVILAKSRSSWGKSYVIIEKESEVGDLIINYLSARKKLQIVSQDHGSMDIRSNPWGTEYLFINELEEEMAIISYKAWSSGELGLVVKENLNINLVLIVAAVIINLKQSGSI